MCRLFGFRSIFSSKIHSSLVRADNALMNQSEFHSDGWGVAYYLQETPHVIKSTLPAIEDSLFKRVSGIVSSETVIAHLRKATQGEKSILNSHPFQFGRWTFAHNGNLKNFENKREVFKSKISEDLQGYVLGDTDSEVLFYYILSKLKLNDEFAVDSIQEKFQECLNEIKSIFGEISKIDSEESTENFLSFLLTDGKVFMAFNGGKTFYYTTHKTKCPESDTCAFYSESCEKSSKSGDIIRHLIISSEVIKGENVWSQTKPGELLILDEDMHFYKDQFLL